MKKLYSLLILFFILFSQLQVGTLYATDQQELADKKTQSIQLLDAVGDKMESVVDQLDARLNNSESSARLEEKGQEIEEYLEEAQKEISNETSSSDITEKLQEVQKVVVLKVVSGITEYEDIEDSISTDVAGTRAEKKEALEVMQDSLENKQGEYSLILTTKLTQEKIAKTLLTLEKDALIDFLYTVGDQNYFEVSFSKQSLFSREMMGDIENNILPESFIGIEVVQPEIFAIETEIPQDANLLTGEDLTQTWGIEEYGVFSHLSDTKTASEQLTVGVVDTGIDYHHPDLQANVLREDGKDFVNKDDDAMDDQGHGTHVAGTIAASINQSGIIGVNPYTKLIPLKICSETGFCPSYAVLKALDYAKEKDIDILNMSLGGRAIVDGHPICDGISDYTSAGGIVVAASGNANIDASEFVPGGCADVITVGAHDQNNQRASFSNYGGKVDLTAPGVDVYSSRLGGGYLKLSGTSMATPHVAGLVSLMQAYDSDITLSQARSGLKEYSNPSVLLTSYTQESVEIAVEVENSDEQEKKVDVSTLNPNISFISADGKDNATGGSGSNIAQLPNTLELSISERPDGVELSSDAQKIDISERFIDTPLPEFYETPELIIFDEESYASQENTGVIVNSLTGDLQDIEVSQEENTHILDGSEDIINNQENTREDLVEIPSDAIAIPEIVEQISIPSSSSHSQQNPTKIQGLPELENGVEINAANQEFQPVEIQSYSDLFPEDNQEAEENIQINSFPQETFSGTLIDELVVGDIFKENTDTVIIADQEEAIYQITEQEEATWLAHINEIIESGTGEILEEENDEIQQEEGININANYTVDVFVGQTVSVSRQRSFKQSGAYGLVGITESGDNLLLQGLAPGTAYLRLKDSRGRTLGNVTVHVTVPVIKKSIPLGGQLSTICNGDSRIYQNITDATIVAGLKANSCLYVEGLKAGSTQVQTQYRSYLRDLYEVSVIEPTQRTINKGARLDIVLGDSGNYTHSVLNGDIISTSISGNTISVTGLYGGESQIEIRDGTQVIQIIQVTVLPPVENIEIKLSDTLRYQIGNFKAIGVSAPGIVETYSDATALDIRAIKMGSTDIPIYENDKPVKILRVTVVDNPERRVQLYKGQIIKYTHSYYKNSATSSNSSIAEVLDSGNSNYEYIAAKQAGDFELTISKDGAQDDLKLYKVLDEPMPVNEVTLIIGDSMSFDYDTDDVKMLNSGIVSQHTPTHTLKAVGLGSTQVLVEEQGYTVKKWNITVIPPVVPVQELYVDQYLPGDSSYETKFSRANEYNYVMDDPSALDIYISTSDLRIRGKKAGSFDVALYYKDLYVTTITVHVKSYTRQQSASMSLYDTDRNHGFGYQYALPEAYKYTYSVSNPGIININQASQDLFFTPLKEGTTEIYIKKDGYHLKTVTFTVTVPEAAADVIPKILKTCETQEDGRCNVYLGEDFGLKFTYSNPGIIQVNTSPDFRDGIIVTGEEVGTTSLYIYKGEQHHYTLDVIVSEKEKPVERYLYCTIEQGSSCQVYLEDAIEYNYISTQRGIFDADLTQNTIEITGKSVGESKLYIYDTKTVIGNGGNPETTNSYYYTIYVDVETPADPLSANTSDISLSLGETYDLYMTSGNGDYGMYLDDPDMMSYKLSGEIFSMKALSAGSTSMSITDSSNRTITMNVTINKELELDERELTIELGESGYLHLVKGSERYGVEKNNNNVEVYRTNDETFEVKALTLGTTAIQITDEFDNGTTANITVVAKGAGSAGGGEEEEESRNNEDEEVGLEEINTLIEQFLQQNSININYRSGCTVLTIDDCYEEDIPKAEEIQKILFIQEIEERAEVAFLNFYNKKSLEEITRLQSALRNNLDAYTGNRKILIEYLVLWIDLKIGNDAFIQGVQDTLTQNTFYDIAIEISAGYGGAKVAGVLIQKFSQKYPETVGKALGKKTIPYVGWGLTVFAMTQAGITNAELIGYCNSSSNTDGQDNQYYCGKLVANGILIAGGVTVAKYDKKFIGVFKNGFATSVVKKSKTTTKGTVTGDLKVIDETEVPENKRALARENESPDILANYGYNIERLSHQGDGKNPDYKINGEIFDNYAPQATTPPRNMADVIEGKITSGQTPGNAVINLGDNTKSIEEVLEQFKKWETPGLKKLLIITKDKEVYELIFK